MYVFDNGEYEGLTYACFVKILTYATSHNIVSPTMLGAVVHANKRNNCQHCLQSSKEAMYSGTYSIPCNARGQTFSRGQRRCGSMQTGATLLRYASPVTEQ